MRNPLFSDPFDEPLRYWLMIKSSILLSEREKKQYLKAVNLDYDNPPKQEVTA